MKLAILIIIVILLIGCTPRYDCSLYSVLEFTELNLTNRSQEIVFFENTWERKIDIQSFYLNNKTTQISFNERPHSVEFTFFLPTKTLYVVEYPNETFRTNIPHLERIAVWRCE